jgi:Na+/H+ antiporter NhaD/arsenite permease-like protein
MAHGRFTKAVVVLLVPLIVCLLVLPNLVAAQEEKEEDACAKAKEDAQRNTSGMWFFAGCLLGLTGVLIAYVVAPSPMASEIMGKDPTWTAQYADCYKSAGKSAQAKKALGGCCVMMAAEVVLLVVLMSASASE